MRFLGPQKKNRIIFSICTMVNDWNKFQKFRSNWGKMGFSSRECEFLICDNSRKNQFDGFEAGRHFLQQAKGQFIMIAHLDSRPMETKGKILSILQKLDSIDPKWAVVGNAGVHRKTGESILLGLTMPGCPTPKHKNEFVPVQALDENLLIIKADARLTFSHDLHGFHFYGLDLCDLARRLGRTCYVARLKWYHNSHGTLDRSFHQARQRFEAKMIHYRRPKLFGTNCGFLSFSGSEIVRAWAKARSCWILRYNEHHTEAERQAAWEAGRANPFFYPAYFLLWIFKKAGLEKRRNRRIFKRESIWPLYG